MKQRAHRTLKEIECQQNRCNREVDGEKYTKKEEQVPGTDNPGQPE